MRKSRWLDIGEKGWCVLLQLWLSLLRLLVPLQLPLLLKPPAIGAAAAAAAATAALRRDVLLRAQHLF